MDKASLAEEYAQKLKPFSGLARKAYGKRTTNSPAHEANREYTRLLIEYYKRGGSLSRLGEKINSSYPSLRRRVLMSSVSMDQAKPPIKMVNHDIKSVAKRVAEAKSSGIESYHDQLAFEYSLGVSLSKLAKELGLSSAAPLYYGVQKSILRKSQNSG